MTNNRNSILFGVSLESYNRGVNALAIGSIQFILRNYKDVNDIHIVNMGKPSHQTHTVLIEDQNIRVQCISVTGKDFVKACIEGVLFRFFGKKPKLELSRIIYFCERAFNINEGDSFSDLYGRYRFFSHFFVSLSVLLWKKPLTFLPQTIGPFKKLYGRLFSTYVLKRLSELYIRDTAADGFLEKRGLTGIQMFDVASLMQPKETALPFNTGNAHTIGLNVNGLMYFNSYGISNNKSSYRLWLKSIVGFFLSKNYNILLIPHTYDISNDFSENDYKANIDFIKINNFQSINNIKSISENLDAQELKSVISQVDLFIGSRMHSCIAALSSNVPCIGIAYSYKFKGTFAKFNQEKCVIDLNSSSSEDLTNLLVQVHNESAEINKILEEINQANY